MELKQLGKYQIVAKIGQGAMGEVFRAYDPILNREVAVKTMSSDMGADEELRKRFQREAQSAARLNHPNIITVYDFGEEQGQVYIAMELLEGNDVKVLIAKKTPLALDEKLALMEQMAEGLAFAHSKGVVHRDLKPANIHVQPGGQVKIMDFGLARFATSDITRAGVIMGTPNYMSPEQVRGEKATTRSDVFSLGAVFYELLTYRKPFAGDTMHSVLSQVVQQDPEPLAQLLPGVPAGLCQVVEKALVKDAEARYRDAAALRDGLRVVRSSMGRAATASPRGAPMERDAQTFLGDAATVTATSAPTLPRSVEPPAPLQRTASGSPDPTRVLPTSRIAETVLAEPAARSATASTRKAAPAIPVPTPARPVSLWFLLAAGTAVVTVVGLYSLYRSEPAPAPETTSAPPLAVPPSVRVSPPPASASSPEALGEARRLIEERDYRAAAARAEALLAREPQNADARALLEQARAALRQSDSAAREFKRALDAGDVDRASAALTQLVELDPRHPDVPALTLRLNAVVKRRAEDARQTLEKARSQPPPSPGSAADPRPPSISSPPAPEPAAAAPPASQPLVQPAAVPALVAPPPSAPVPSALPPQTEAQARQAIQGVLEAYRAAFESLNAEALRAIHPTVDYEGMKTRFASVTAFDVKIKVQSVTRQGDSATASCLVTYTPKPKPAGKIAPVPTVFHLKRSGAVWIIDRVARS